MKNVKIEAKNGVIAISTKEDSESREFLYKKSCLTCIHIRETDSAGVISMEFDVAEYSVFPNSSYESGLDGELSLFVESVNGVEVKDFEMLKNEVKKLIYE